MINALRPYQFQVFIAVTAEVTRGQARTLDKLPSLESQIVTSYGGEASVG